MNMEEGEDLSKVSSFLINNAITARAGYVGSIRKLQNGMLEVETRKNKQTSHY